MGDARPGAPPPAPPRRPLHVAVVMDGNGRWAVRRGLPRVAGHVAGARAAREVVAAAADLGVGVLTLFAFSSDNWRRPRGEVARILALLRRFLRTEAAACRDVGTRLEVIGRRDRLPTALREEVERAEAATEAGRGMRLRVAVDYSGRDAIVAAAARSSATGATTREGFARCLAPGLAVPDVDLFLRPGGERRLSDFLLWESAYAELVFLDRLWPDVTRDDLAAALADFRGRDRRFGGVPSAVR